MRFSHVKQPADPSKVPSCYFLLDDLLQIVGLLESDIESIQQTLYCNTNIQQLFTERRAGQDPYIVIDVPDF